MSVSRCLVTAVLVGVVAAGSACTQKATDDTKRNADPALDAAKTGADKAIDATKKAGNEAADVTKDVAEKTADKTEQVAGKVAETGKEVASATGEAITDGWITTKVKAKFADETILRGSDINVDTSDRVVTLRGTVPSVAAKARAAEIARGTEHVTRVVDRLVVKAK